MGTSCLWALTPLEWMNFSNKRENWVTVGDPPQNFSMATFSSEVADQSRVWKYLQMAE